MQIFPIRIRQLRLHVIRPILFSHHYINKNRQLKKETNGTSVVNQRSRNKYFSRYDHINVSVKKKQNLS